MIRNDPLPVTKPNTAKMRLIEQPFHVYNVDTAPVQSKAAT
jgi:hypothetical protein